MSLDWNSERKNFPAVERAAYLMTAAVGPISKKVYESYSSHYQAMHQEGDHHYQTQLDNLEKSRKLVARYFRAASVDDIGFAPNSSHGMNLVALMLKEKGAAGEILMPKDEFPSSSIPWMHQGYQVRFVEGPDELISQSGKRTAAVVCSAVQFGTGYRADLVRLGRELQSKNIPFIVNATQSIGVFPSPVQQIGVSALVASCHKWLCAGYGTSVFYAHPTFRRESRWPFAGWLSTQDVNMKNDVATIRDATSAIETGVSNFAVMAAVGVALEEVERLGLENISERVHSLSNKLALALEESGFETLSIRDTEKDWKKSINSGTLLVKIPEPEKIAEKLALEKIYVTARGGGLRISVHYFNDESDIARLVAILKKHSKI